MSIVDFIAVVSFGLTCFSIGYTLGKDNHKPLDLGMNTIHICYIAVF